jgi:hypothetical protein
MAMVRPFLEALLARLFLVAAVLLGASPSQGLVLCFEPDGTIALELPGTDNPCRPSRASGEDGQDVGIASRNGCCGCTDIAIGERSVDALVQPSRVTFHFDATVTMAPVTWLAPPSGIERAPSVRVESPPGPRGVLAHIRTIELRV